MIYQTEIVLPPARRGCHLITRIIEQHIAGHMPDTGLLNIFVKHTSCGLTINENADPDVLIDMSHILDHIVPEREPYYLHTIEGDDDMPAHAKSSLTGTSLNLPITHRRLNLGTWQGIYLCEYRDHATPRRIVLTVYS